MVDILLAVLLEVPPVSYTSEWATAILERRLVARLAPERLDFYYRSAGYVPYQVAGPVSLTRAEGADGTVNLNSSAARSTAWRHALLDRIAGSVAAGRRTLAIVIDAFIYEPGEQTTQAAEPGIVQTDLPTMHEDLARRIAAGPFPGPATGRDDRISQQRARTPVSAADAGLMGQNLAPDQA